MGKETDSRRFIRVELMEYANKVTLGGFVSAALLLLHLKLGLPPICSSEEIYKKMKAEKDIRILNLFNCIMVLCDIPQPEVYTNDHVNHYCLYSVDEFEEIREDLCWISKQLRDLRDDFVLVSKDFFLQEILYEDSYQVVITKETYDRHKGEHEYEPLGGAPKL